MTLSDESYSIIGDFLEGKGLSHEQIDEYFLEHHGVKGMHWKVKGPHGAVTKVLAKHGHRVVTKRGAPKKKVKKVQLQTEEVYKDNFGTAKVPTGGDKSAINKNAVVQRGPHARHVIGRILTKHGSKPIPKKNVAKIGHVVKTSGGVSALNQNPTMVSHILKNHGHKPLTPIQTLKK